ncbi:hypothetical protein CA13_34300 [Planctomycetes bacterium CA13]|uniref:Uncharacterized protein n=1 Tax=Novipirellula herctigrandis TaxID=2527986 RepID=A0A5C5Z440_9BACT|nr:hypothetical protein CA13_34300 [Planctomycetes bacterium CA13]
MTGRFNDYPLTAIRIQVPARFKHIKAASFIN